MKDPDQVPLVAAVEAGDEVAALVLLAGGADPNAPYRFLMEGDHPGEPPSEMWSPVLDRALRRGFMTLAMALIRDRRFDPRGWYFGTNGSLRRDAVWCGDIAFAQAVFALNPPQEKPQWILAAAGAGGHIAMLEWLRGQGFDFRRHGVEALCKAAQQGKAAAVDWLLAAGVPVNGRSELGRWTALTHAGAYDRGAIIDTLLAHGADPRIPDDGGRPPAHWASFNGHHEMAARLDALAKRR